MLRRLKRKGTRRLVVLMSDTHCGNRLGLLNPDTVLLEEDEQGEITEYSPALGPTQRYLWKLYTSHLDKMAEMAAGDEVVVIVNGDLTHGTKYPDGLAQNRISDQVAIAFWCLRPWLERDDLNVKKLRVLRGTGSHTDYGSAESMVAMLLKKAFPRHDIEVLYHALFDFDGVLFDVAHHGPGPGIRVWTDGNQQRYYLRSLMLQHVLDNQEPPRIVARAHYHRWARETVRTEWGGREYKSDIIATPSYCGINGHGRQVTRSVHKQTHGLVVCEVADGQIVQIKPIKKSLDLRTKAQL